MSTEDTLLYIQNTGNCNNHSMINDQQVYILGASNYYTIASKQHNLQEVNSPSLEQPICQAKD